MATVTEQRDNNRTDYTEGSILRSILAMGLPSMFGFLSQSIYALADTFWVARLPGQEAGVAAITFFNNILWVVFAFNSLVGPGSVAVISRRYGEKAFDTAEKAIKETFLLKLIFGAVIGAVGYWSAPYLLRFVGAEGDSLAYAIAYGRVMFLGLPILYATYSVFTAMRSIANPTMAMFLMIGSNLLNIGLDPLLIFGWAGFPAFGIVGAAYASVFSFSVTFAIGLFLFYSGRTNVRMTVRGKEAVSIATMWKIVRIGVPAWIGELSFSGSRMIIVPLVATFGTIVVAAYGVGTQLFGFGMMLLVGIGLGLSSLIGHNLGGGKVERAKQTADKSILIGISILTVYGLLLFAGARLIMGLFFENPETIDAGVTLLRIMTIGFPFFGMLIMIEQIHGGVGMNMPVMIVIAIHGWLLQVLPILLLVQVFELGQTAVWWTFAVSAMVSSLGFYGYYRRGRWLAHQV